MLLISSAAAFTVLPGMSAYCAAKAGLERFGDALRLEVAYRGVTVASAHPTWIDTDMVRDTEDALPTFKADPQAAARAAGRLHLGGGLRRGARGEPGDARPARVRAGLGRASSPRCASWSPGCSPRRWR